MVALKHCLDEKRDVKERKHLDVFMMQSMSWCSLLYPLGWLQQSGVPTPLGTLERYLGQVPEGSCSRGLPSSRSAWGQCECWGICTSSRSQHTGDAVHEELQHVLVGVRADRGQGAEEGIWTNMQ